MKKRELFFQKVLAVFTAAIMSVMVTIPGTIFAASADDYTVSEDGNTYYVGSADAWNQLAALGLTFEGKTIELTGNIDAGGAELKSLSTAFVGTFDGKGFTVSNSGISAALIASEVTAAGATIRNLVIRGVTLTRTSGNHGIVVDVTRGMVTITDVTLTDCTVSAPSNGGIGGVIGALYAVGHLKAERCKVQNMNLTAKQQTGLFLGRSSNPASTIEMRNCEISGSLSAAGDRLGGVIGECFSSVLLDGILVDLSITNPAATGDTGGVIGQLCLNKSTTAYNATVRNVKVKASATIAGNDSGGLGGIIGTVYLGETSVLELENVYTEGSLTIQKGNAGGLIGFSVISNSTAVSNIRNCESQMTVTSNTPNAWHGVGSLIGQWGRTNQSGYGGTLNISDCVAGGIVAGTMTNTSGPDCAGGIIGMLACASTVSPSVNIQNCIILRRLPQRRIKGITHC